MDFKNTINTKTLNEKIDADPDMQDNEGTLITEEGWHNVDITSVQDREDKHGHPHVLICYKNADKAMAFDRLYLTHQDIRRQKIGWKRLGRLLRATGIESADSTDALEGERLAIRIAERNGYHNVVDIAVATDLAKVKAAPQPAKKAAPVPQPAETDDIPF